MEITATNNNKTSLKSFPHEKKDFFLVFLFSFMA